MKNYLLIILQMIQKKNRFHHKISYFEPICQIPKYTNKQKQQILTMFCFQLVEINQQEFEKLAELLLKYSMAYAILKFFVGKYVHTTPFQ